ncbi:MAG: SDR family NAD(P)-dependent oxidoreductase [Spirochaetes bacterium]|nr:SDR family NAD(P)-dependent oxidoreductase [Spirochaetota bacterium]MBN2769542.1 SDR family NAD(P)-dependent oxidoreductase [Spirochaetota bacterium]
MIDIRDKWALVTGASRGVGFRVARALSKNGANVILHSRKLEGTAALYEELKSEGSVVKQVEGELGDPLALQNIITEVSKLASAGLDILYNNAAIMTAYRNIYEVTVDEYMQSFMVNCVAPAKLCDAFLPGMLKKNFGRIVNVTSGIADQPQLMAYSCSKAALDRYVRDMLPTLDKTNVLMNLMDPGWLSTDLGGDKAPNHPDTVLPGALVPVLLEQSDGSGKLYCAQDYREDIK